MVYKVKSLNLREQFKNLKKIRDYEMKELTHMHLTVNARVDRNFFELPREKAQQFVNELMKITNMKPLGPLNWSDAADLDFPGQSFVQMITTSHSSLHFFRDESGNGENNEIYFDLYSCKDFDYERVVSLIDRYFGVMEWHGILYNRSSTKKPVVMLIGSEKKKIKSIS